MLVKNGTIFLDGHYHSGLDIRIQNGIIAEIGRNLQDPEVLDAKGSFVFPGFIDVHIHGAAFVNCWDGEEAVRKICKVLPQYGVTSFLPTLRANDVEKSVLGIRGIRAAYGAEGADIPGIHLYTGYRNRSIAYYPDHIPPTIQHTLALTDNNLSDIKIALSAPELPGAMEWISWIASQGIIPEIAFNEGTSEQMSEAAERGAILTDHFFNGFPLMDHHTNGSTVGCLIDDRINLTLNCDCIHVAPAFIRLAIKVKGIDRIIGVSDSSVYVGAKEGKYVRENGQVVFVKDGAVRDINGKLVTGAHSYDANMRTMLKNGFSLEEIGKIFAENCADILSFNDRGKIAVRRRGDLVIMNPKLEVEKTLIKGQVVFSRS